MILGIQTFSKFIPILHFSDLY